MSILSYQEKHDKYEKIFSPEKYMGFWNALTLDKEKSDLEVSSGQRTMRFSIRSINDFISLICRRRQNIKFHDLGCGPSVVNMLSAAAFPQITSVEGSDFLSSNLDYLKISINSEGKQGYNYTKIIEFINSMNEQRGHLNLNNYFIPLKDKCLPENFVKYDMSLEDIFCGRKMQWGTYDVVVSTMFLTDAVPSKGHYRNVLRTVNRMLKLGGTFCLLDFLNQSFWTPCIKGMQKLSAVPINLQFLEKSLPATGFEIEEMRVIHHEENKFCNGDKVACVRATKAKDL
uniref:Phenylethanolamine N methyltransferase 2 n=1 Tax=Hofstenia miamia TaxID=442651 RepID=A0A7G7LK79_HOFMI|nr:phenylethanolamine N methyltransferase 2 [Hofstenia miamia]